jgi:hypothetical protein
VKEWRGRKEKRHISRRPRNREAGNSSCTTFLATDQRENTMSIQSHQTKKCEILWGWSASGEGGEQRQPRDFGLQESREVHDVPDNIRAEAVKKRK